LVREIVARKERGEGIKRIARELGVDRKTVRRWLDWAVGSRVGRALGGGPSISSPTLLRGAGLK
jgi:transposase-like protein